MGLVTYDGQSNFFTMPLLDTLRKDAASSLRGAALLIPASGHWLPWGRLSEAVKTGVKRWLLLGTMHGHISLTVRTKPPCSRTQ